jgi:hypothetical protein
MDVAEASEAFDSKLIKKTSLSTSVAGRFSTLEGVAQQNDGIKDANIIFKEAVSGPKRFIGSLKALAAEKGDGSAKLESSSKDDLSGSGRTSSRKSINDEKLESSMAKFEKSLSERENKSSGSSPKSSAAKLVSDTLNLLSSTLFLSFLILFYMHMHF